MGPRKVSSFYESSNSSMRCATPPSIHPGIFLYDGQKGVLFLRSTHPAAPRTNSFRGWKICRNRRRRIRNFLISSYQGARAQHGTLLGRIEFQDKREAATIHWKALSWILARCGGPPEKTRAHITIVSAHIIEQGVPGSEFLARVTSRTSGAGQDEGGRVAADMLVHRKGLALLIRGSARFTLLRWMLRRGGHPGWVCLGISNYDADDQTAVVKGLPLEQSRSRIRESASRGRWERIGFAKKTMQ